MKHRIRWENKNFDDMGTLNRSELSSASVSNKSSCKNVFFLQVYFHANHIFFYYLSVILFSTVVLIGDTVNK